VLDGTVQALLSAVEARDPYTAMHQRRVALLAAAVAQEFGLPREMVESVGRAGLVHDIGTLSVPAEILGKPGRLSSSELEVVRGHAQAGHDILAKIEFDRPIARIALEHHERLDGSGYPRGRRGDSLLLESRVLAVADVVEAMASHRPYRPALGIDAALEEIQGHRGTWFETGAVDACLRLFRSGRVRFCAARGGGPATATRRRARPARRRPARPSPAAGSGPAGRNRSPRPGSAPPPPRRGTRSSSPPR
jgi:putative nucleotidyltransferase with HDIG domain